MATMNESHSESTSSCSDLSSNSYSDQSESFDSQDSSGLEIKTFSSDVVIEQYAQDVADFSSQYGSDYSISYTALNMTGRPCKYPDYGDFPETYAMRTYGDWWDEAPSRLPEIRPQNNPQINAHDFIVLIFEQFVIPEKLILFETYNPGALVRIWSLDITEKWILLWEGDAQKCGAKSRKFSPPLKKMKLPTKIIRLEFNHSSLEYFTELDGITLIGKKCNIFGKSDLTFCKHRVKGPILRKLENLKFRPCHNENHQDYLHDFLVNDLEKFIRETALLHDDLEKENTQIGLKDMPCEILLKIFSYLDMVSLFRVGEVNKQMYEMSNHPLLYSEINLKPYWHLATSELLRTLAKRCTLLKKLDFSWCGIYGTISPTEFKKFIQQRGDNLTHLRLNSCRFLNASCMDTVGIACDNLKELSLRNYSNETQILTFSCLANLRNLERLDLFRTYIETDLLLTLLENNPKLKHLNLAFCGIGVNMDEIAIHISKYNRELISVDMWKSHSLSSIGLHALSRCSKLEEVDFGWCLREEALPGESLKCLLQGCPNLKKLFLAAIRGITDRDLENIANLCPNLEQLDLMGVLGISTEKCFDILVKCKKLKLLDLSFCDHIDELQINLWRNRFPVSIKRSCAASQFLG